MAVIKVPKTPRSSFNPGRRPSALLLDQIRHLEWAALPARQRGPGGDLPARTVKTEGDAAERIAQLSALIREQQAAPYKAGEVPHVTLPPLPRARARTPAKPGAARPRKSRKKSASKAATRASASKGTRAARPRTTTKSAKAAVARKRGRRGSKAR